MGDVWGSMRPNPDLLLREGPVLVVPQTLDVYGRIVADVYVNDANVAEVLREEGFTKRQ